MLLTITQVSKTYGEHQVLDSVGLTLGAGMRLGLVGANGVGKSTLLRIIMGQIEADQSTISFSRGVRLGYLAQVDDDPGDTTLEDRLAAAAARVRALETQLREMETHMAELQGEALHSLMDDYAHTLESFEAADGYDLDHRIVEILSGLKIDHIGRDRLISTLSGGEKSRLRLALLLLEAPDLLLLDEPTNHLDQYCLEWLENHLSRYRGGMLIVSHDRLFLNRTVNGIIEIEEHSHRAKRYAGNYDDYAAAKRQERERWRLDYQRQQEEIKTLRYQVKVSARQVAHNRPCRDNDKFLKGFKDGRVSVAIARRVHNAEERLAQIEADPIPEPPDDLGFDPDFAPDVFEGKFPLIASQLSKQYGERILFQGVSFTLPARARMVITGPNGAGKTTLLTILAGLLKPDTGEVIRSPQTRIAFIDQECESLSPSQTLFEAYRAGLGGPDQPHITVLLGSGLFRYPDLGKRISALSSGQKRKLQIARAIAEKANVLLLDEPTNYVSFDVLETFENALRVFPGAIIAVTHDRRFIESFGGEVWRLEEGKLRFMQ
ncbi:Energy-dependent translational throttle protein EttA [Anaerolineae bacterium]|nr:Energy-dependent translational throttle protein EttA [Anaerolineae bacterium]